VIKTDPNGKAPFRSPYPISPLEGAELWRVIDRSIHCGWIDPFRSNLGSRVVFMPKLDGTLWMCLDCRTVHAITVNDVYPLSNIEDLLNSMHGFCLFTKLDLAPGYNQICIATADRQKVAFTTTFGLCEWRDLPFGLANAPNHLMCIMNGILE